MVLKRINALGEALRSRFEQSTGDALPHELPPALIKYWNAVTVFPVIITLLLAPGLFVRIPLALLWVALSFVLACLQGVYVTYQLVMIALSLVFLARRPRGTAEGSFFFGSRGVRRIVFRRGGRSSFRRVAAPPRPRDRRSDASRWRRGIASPTRRGGAAGAGSSRVAAAATPI